VRAEIKFGVDSSRRFSFRARTQTHKVTDACSDDPTHLSATAGVGNYLKLTINFFIHFISVIIVIIIIVVVAKINLELYAL